MRVWRGKPFKPLHGAGVRALHVSAAAPDVKVSWVPADEWIPEQPAPPELPAAGPARATARARARPAATCAAGAAGPACTRSAAK